MSLIIHREFQLARLLDSERDNPLELTVVTAPGEPGRVTLILENRDLGTWDALTLDIAELEAALKLVALPRKHYIED